MRDATAAPALSVVITDFNGWAQTEVCLQHLRASSYRDFHVIVVDHGTTDETANGLATFAECTRVAASPDLWWTGATNVGIRKAMELGATRIMLLNNDGYVTPTTLAELMVGVSAYPDHVIAPVQRGTSSDAVVVARAGTCFTLGFPTIVLPYMRKLTSGVGGLVPTRMIIGGRGVIVPVSVFDSVGLFDEAALPHYAADHDFYMRCRQHDVALRIAPTASVAIDDTRTTIAKNLGSMKLAEFVASFSNPRSHRNIATLRTLFGRYYPIRPLYYVGVALNVLRYAISYLVARLLAPLRR